MCLLSFGGFTQVFNSHTRKTMFRVSAGVCDDDTDAFQWFKASYLHIKVTAIRGRVKCHCHGDILHYHLDPALEG